MRVTLTYDGKDFEIDGITINDSVFEKIDYRIVDREQQINDLIMWIAESKRDGDKYLMKEDLKYLMKLDDEFVFSSLNTNHFIAKSDNEEEFNKLCKEILRLNNKVKKKK